MMNRTRNSRFQRGSGVYVCRVCERRTRATGVQALGSELCPQCWDLAGWDNSVNDGNSTLDEVMAERDRLLREAIKGGGSEAKIKAAFDFLWPTN